MMQRGLTGAVLIAVILLFRALGARWVPKRILCALWVAAALYLLLPIRIPSALNVYALLPEKPAPGIPAMSGTAKVLSEPVLPREPTSGIAGLTARIVAVGRGLLGGWLLLSYVLGMCRLHSGKPEDRPYLRTWRAQHPLRRPLRILSSSRTAVPISGGLLVPVILLPEGSTCTERELECILTHEFLHICHLDALWKLVFSLCLCVWWFHPAVWVLVLLANRDIEYACDEAVLSTGIRPRDYGAALIRMELRRSDRLAPANSFAAGKLVSRVDRIRGSRICRPLNWCAAAAAAVLILVCFATVPARSAEPAEAAILQPTEENTARAEISKFIWPEWLQSQSAAWGEELGEPHPVPDAYSSFPLLGERTDLTFSEIEAASLELKQACHPHLLRVTSDGLRYTVQVYDFPDSMRN